MCIRIVRVWLRLRVRVERLGGEIIRIRNYKLILEISITVKNNSLKKKSK